MMNDLILALVAFCVLLLLVALGLLWRVRALAQRLDDADFQNRSLSSTYGRITEQWFPLMEAYPYDPQQFRFLGSPLDGVQFEEDRIVFIEFKTNRSRLSKRQQRLRELIEAGEAGSFSFREWNRLNWVHVFLVSFFGSSSAFSVGIFGQGS